MANNDSHFIRRFKFDVEVEDREKANKTQEELSRIFTNSLQRILEEALDEFEVQGHLLRIQNLELDLGDLSEAYFESDLIDRFRSAIRKELAEIRAKATYGTSYFHRNEELIPLWPAKLEMVSYFLEFGHLPASAAGIPERVDQVFSELIREIPIEVRQKVRELFQRRPYVAKRLVEQFPETVVEQVFRVFNESFFIFIQREYVAIARQISVEYGLDQGEMLKLVQEASLVHLVKNEHRTFNRRNFFKSVRSFVERRTQQDLERAFPDEEGSDDLERRLTLDRRYQPFIALIRQVMAGEVGPSEASKVVNAFEVLIRFHSEALKEVVLGGSKDKKAFFNLIRLLPTTSVHRFIQQVSPGTGGEVLRVALRAIAAHSQFLKGPAADTKFRDETYTSLLLYVSQTPSSSQSARSFSEFLKSELGASGETPEKLIETWEEVVGAGDKPEAPEVEETGSEKEAVQEPEEQEAEAEKPTDETTDEGVQEVAEEEDEELAETPGEEQTEDGEVPGEEEVKPAEDKADVEQEDEGEEIDTVESDQEEEKPVEEETAPEEEQPEAGEEGTATEDETADDAQDEESEEKAVDIAEDAEEAEEDTEAVAETESEQEIGEEAEEALADEKEEAGEDEPGDGQIDEAIEGEDESVPEEESPEGADEGEAETPSDPQEDDPIEDSAEDPTSEVSPDQPVEEEAIPTGDSERTRIDFVLHILETGEVPWWGKNLVEPDPIKAFSSLVEQNSSIFLEELKQKVKEVPAPTRALLASRMLEMFGDTAAQSLLKQALPEIFGLYVTVSLLVERYRKVAKPTILVQSLQDPNTFRWYPILRFYLDHIDALPGPPELIKYVVRMVAATTGTPAEKTAQIMRQVVGEAVQKGEMRFLPIQTMLPRANQTLDLATPTAETSIQFEEEIAESLAAATPSEENYPEDTESPEETEETSGQSAELEASREEETAETADEVGEEQAVEAETPTEESEAEVATGEEEGGEELPQEETAVEPEDTPTEEQPEDAKEEEDVEVESTPEEATEEVAEEKDGEEQAETEALEGEESPATDEGGVEAEEGEEPLKEPGEEDKANPESESEEEARKEEKEEEQESEVGVEEGEETDQDGAGEEEETGTEETAEQTETEGEKETPESGGDEISGEDVQSETPEVPEAEGEEIHEEQPEDVEVPGEQVEAEPESDPETDTTEDPETQEEDAEEAAEESPEVEDETQPEGIEDETEEGPGTDETTEGGDEETGEEPVTETEEEPSLSKEEIEEEIRKILDEPEVSQEETVLYYLRTGTLPREVAGLSEPTIWAMINEVIGSSPEKVEEVLREQSKTPGMAKRIANLPVPIFEAIARLLIPEAQKEQFTRFFREIRKLFTAVNAPLKPVQVAAQAFRYLAREEGSRLRLEDYIRELVDHMQEETRQARADLIDWLAEESEQKPSLVSVSLEEVLASLKGELEPPIDEADIEEPDQRDVDDPDLPIPMPESQEEEEEIYINNAGLVLFVPMLSRIFKSMKWLDMQGRFVSDAIQERSIHFLAYLSHKQNETREEDLVLNKLMAGWELNVPVKADITLTEEEMQVAEDMIDEIRSKWRGMENTKNDTFRASWLQREGRLRKDKYTSWVLRVDQKAYDILLNRLPYSVPMFDASWTSTTIRVEWQ